MHFFSFSHLSGIKVVFEDDDRSAYAYFLDQSEKIIGDVWIYNVDFTPDYREWEGDSEPPFRNASEYVQNHPFPRVQNEEEVAVSFEFESENAERPIALLHIRDTFIAMLKPNARPGWSANARIDGPLALRLDSASSGQLPTLTGKAPEARPEKPGK